MFIRRILHPCLRTRNITNMGDVLVAAGGGGGTHNKVLDCTRTIASLRLLQGVGVSNRCRHRIFAAVFSLCTLPSSFPNCRTTGTVNRPCTHITTLRATFTRTVGSDHFVPCVRLRRFRILLFYNVSCLTGHCPNYRGHYRRLGGSLRGADGPRLVGGDPRATPDGHVVGTVRKSGGRRCGCGGPTANGSIAGDINVSRLHTQYDRFGR